MPMLDEDKIEFRKARPFVVGFVALMFDLFGPASSHEEAFVEAEKFVAEFETRC